MSTGSAHHLLLKDIRRAAASGRLTSSGLAVAEGPHLLEEALSGKWAAEMVVTTAAGREKYAYLLQRTSAEILVIPAKIFGRIAATETAQELLTLLRPRACTWADIFAGVPALIIVLDGIQDPGNAGTMARSAEAFGATGLVLTVGSVRASNGKFLRAAAGSIFRLPYLDGVAPEEAILCLKVAGVTVLSLAPDGETQLRNADLRSAVALVVGNEGAGVSAALRAAGSSLSIPTAGRVESLNAGVACSLALYEAHNQRVVNESV